MTGIDAGHAAGVAQGAVPSARSVVDGMPGVALTVLRGFRDGLLAGIGRMAVWRERQVQRRALASLSPELLTDIGVSRADALRESRKPFWRP
jgi:uncharacterized protein YjiS (DUF1127 family)